MVLLHRSHNSEMSACFFLCASLEELWWRRPPPSPKHWATATSLRQTLFMSQVDSCFRRLRWHRSIARQVTHGHVLALALTALQENQGGLMVGFLLSFCLFDSSKSNNKVVFWRHQSTDVQRCLMSCRPLAAGLLGQDECSHPVPKIGSFPSCWLIETNTPVHFGRGSTWAGISPGFKLQRLWGGQIACPHGFSHFSASNAKHCLLDCTWHLRHQQLNC